MEDQASSSNPGCDMKRTFLVSTAMLLLITAALKLYSAAGAARILSEVDPLFLLPNRVVMTGVGCTELLVAAYLFLGENERIKLLGTAWLGSAFLAYRFTLWLLNVPASCPCL